MNKEDAMLTIHNFEAGADSILWSKNAKRTDGALDVFHQLKTTGNTVRESFIKVALVEMVKHVTSLAPLITRFDEHFTAGDIEKVLSVGEDLTEHLVDIRNYAVLIYAGLTEVTNVAYINRTHSPLPTLPAGEKVAIKRVKSHKKGGK